ncbi:MAG: WG repeat-containing protein [Prolixibacteraceae bacterium]|nr:WG repeat-containing protein [Prolixibacteraceae bacterium]
MAKIILIIYFVLVGTAVHAQLIPFYSATDDKYGYKDGGGKIVVEPRYDLAYPFTEGLAAVRLAGKYGYLNENGKEVVSPKYDFTWHFIGGFAVVKLADRFGFIDKAGKEVTPLIYEEANNYHGNCCYKGISLYDRFSWLINPKLIAQSIVLRYAGRLDSTNFGTACPAVFIIVM